MGLCIIEPVQTFRRAHWILRFVLVWLTLFIGAAAASPLVKSEGLQMVCSGLGGMQLVNLDAGDDADSLLTQGLDCPLCLQAAAPAPSPCKLPHPSGLAHALHPIASARLASLIGLPWQARAPPSLSC